MPRTVTLIALLSACFGFAQRPPAQTSGWQGEWGSFHPAANHRYEGAGVRIGECSATGCSFAIDVNTATGNGDARGTLQFDSPTTATAHLLSFGQEHCTLKLTRNGNTLATTAGTGDCTYFQTPGITFLGTFALHTRSLFEGDRAAECFSTSEPAPLALCTSGALAAQQRSWNLLLLRVLELEGLGGKEETEKADLEESSILRRCSTNSDPAACLAAAYAQSTVALQQRQAAWEARMNTPGDAAQAAAMAKSVAGTYRRRFRNGDVQGDSFTSTDRLKLQALPDARLRYNLYLEFYNGHQCNIDGIATLRSAGMFVDVKPSQNAKDMACYFEIIPLATGVKFADPTGQCKMLTCGERGGYNGAEFRLSDRVQVPARKP